MSISLNANFELLSAGLYLDARQQFNTIIEMKDFAETSIPDGFITYNKETQKHYVFNSSNTADATLGKWREYNSGGGSSEEQIKDWVSGSSYSEGDYIYHEGELYRCLASNNNVDFDETNWEQLTYGIDELTKEDVERLLGLTKEEIEAMADLILDTEVRIDKTYSSSKIYTDIQQCLEDSKTYTLEELGKFSGVSYKIVASTSEMTSESIMYLLANGSTYDMYIVEENGATTKIGDMNIDLSQYYTKTKIDNDFLKKVDANGKYATITAVNGKANTTDLTTHTGDANIHVTTTDKAKWDKVTDKLNVADFNTHKNNTDIHITKKEKDKLVTTDNITDTIDINSSGTKIPNVKAVYNDIIIGKDISQTVIDTYGTEILKYPIGIWRFGTVGTASKFADLPVQTGGRIEITSIKADTNSNPWNSAWAYRVYNFETYTGMNYVRKITSADKAGVRSDTGWKELATIDNTIETISNPTELDTNKYIKNGFYSIGDVTKRTNLPTQKVGTLLVYYAGYYVIQEYILNETLRRFMRRSIDKGKTWSDWKELATMDKLNYSTVADVSKTLTPLFPSVVKVASGGVAINYIVRNGWCNVNFKFNITSSTTFSWTDIAWGLPIPANSVDTVLMSDGKATQPIPIKITSTGSVSSKVLSAISTTDWWTGNITYPVAE